MPYPRQAWLELDGDRLDLDDFDAGYTTTELDIGFPAVREVADNLPDRDGVNDRTRLSGSRVVTAVIYAWPGGHTKIDDIARLFGRFLWPGARPQLHWTLDTEDHAERMLTLRAADHQGPMGPPISRQLQFGWVAPDPVIYDPVWQTATGRPEETVRNGRVYDLTFDRFYPLDVLAGESATLTVGGDVPARPAIRVHGPITHPVITLEKDLEITDQTPVTVTFAFDQSLTISTGRWVEIDVAARRVVDDTGSRLEARVDWSESSPWPKLALNPRVPWTLRLQGSSVSPVTQVQARWLRGFMEP